ncbi:MAG: SPOR domain-containing protein, partial [Bacteroidales bacterium]|nr:SPOR domain-containing protein [Bacteroidales bacterium]
AVESFLNDTNYISAHNSLNEIENELVQFQPPPNIKKQVQKLLPKVSVTVNTQSKSQGILATKYFEEYTDLADEAAAFETKAEKKKPGKKKDNLLHEANKLNKRAAIKYDNYSKSRAKSDKLNDQYETSIENQQILDNHFEILEERSSENYRIPSQNFDFDLESFIYTFINNGILKGSCNELITSQIKTISPDLVQTSINTEPVKSVQVYNLVGYNSKESLYNKTLKLVNTEKSLLKLKETENISIKYDCSKFLAKVSKAVEQDLALIAQSTKNMNVDSKGIINVPEPVNNEATWIDLVGEFYNLKEEGAHKDLMMMEYYDAIRIGHLNDFITTLIKIEQLNSGIPESEDANLANSYIEEAEFLIIKSLENKNKALIETDRDKKTYWLEDGVVFEKAANEQIEIAYSVYKSVNPSGNLILNELNKDIYSKDLVYLQLKEDVTTSFSNESELSGVIFRIQLIAITKDVEDSFFKGISPIYREKVNNSTTIRYLGGQFNNLQDAETARDKYKLKGFENSFVVAYKNGKRIPLEQALVSSENNRIKENRQEVITDPSPDLPAPVDLKGTQDISTFSGSGFFIQIGSFASPKPDNSWSTIKPDYVEKTDRGIHKYYKGPYTNESEAEGKRKEFIRNGIPDAFMIFYLDGQRTIIEEDTLKIQEKPLIAEQVVENDQKLPVFKIQLGAYSEARNSKWIVEKSNLIGETIEKKTNINGTYIYLAGNFTSLDDARILKDHVRSNNYFPDAFITAYLKGNKIPVKEAIQIITNSHK